MLVNSEINNQQYEDKDCVFFRNPLQSAYYKEWGAELIDLFVGGDKRWVWVFKSKDHERLIGKWNSYKEDNK